jgi:chloramphenicol-sensitive protein RarD
MGRPSPPDARAPTASLAAGFGAFLIWGLIPIFFKAMAEVPPVEIVAHRIVWAALLIAAFVWAAGQGDRTMGLLAHPRLLLGLAGSSGLLTLNWLVYIWAVNNDRMLETSLGYFINPLVNIALGVAFLDERLNKVQWLAVALAAAGVGIMAVGHGTLPWIPLVLAVSFGLYGLMRKVMPVDPVGGLLIETLMMTPVSLGYLVWLGGTGEGAFLAGSRTLDVMLAATGVATAVPLTLFVIAARGLRLSTLGFIQYLAPSTTFLLGVFLYREPLTPALGVTFAFVWAGLALYSADLLRQR